MQEERKFESMEKGLAFFEKNKKSLIEKYYKKFIVIYNDQVVNFFNDILSAINYGQINYGMGNFFVKYCDEDDSTTQYFTSRVSFTSL
ncbi:MAG: hypothetical protein PHT30_03815 [Bacilli bacterium]|nr:hypothetical protein [Bacilli bacterium]